MDSQTSGRDLCALPDLLLTRDRLSSRELPGVLSRVRYVALVLARKLRLSLAVALLGGVIADNLLAFAFELVGTLREIEGLADLPSSLPDDFDASALAAKAAGPVMIPMTDVARRTGKSLLPTGVFALSEHPTS